MMFNSDDELLLSFADDKRRLCEDNCMLTNTGFLDIRQQSLIMNRFNRLKESRLFLYSGTEDAERAIAVFVPEVFSINSAAELVQYFDENEQDNPLAAVRISKDRFSAPLTHRDYLGALMGLGIKREVLGELIVSENGCDLIAIKSICAYIIDNLKSAGRATVNCAACRMNELQVPQLHFEELFVSVASMRLDVTIGAVYNLSRTKAAEAIAAGLVYVNGVQSEKTDMRVSCGDKLVLRGTGKAIIDSELGQSKKGRIRLNVKRYV